MISSFFLHIFEENISPRQRYHCEAISHAVRRISLGIGHIPMPNTLKAALSLFNRDFLGKSDAAAAIGISEHDDLNTVGSRIDSFYLPAIRRDRRIDFICLQNLSGSKFHAVVIRGGYPNAGNPGKVNSLPHQQLPQ